MKIDFVNTVIITGITKCIFKAVCVCVSILTGFEWVFHILNYNEMWLLSLKIIHKIWVVLNSCIFNWIKSEMCIFSFFPTIQSKTSYYGYNFVLLFHFQLTSDCHLHYIHQIVIINHNCLRTTHTQRGREKYIFYLLTNLWV